MQRCSSALDKDNAIQDSEDTQVNKKKYLYEELEMLFVGRMSLCVGCGSNTGTLMLLRGLGYYEDRYRAGGSSEGCCYTSRIFTHQ